MKFNDSRIQNNQIAASSHFNQNTFPRHGRLDFNINQGWEPGRGKFCKMPLKFTFKKPAMLLVINKIIQFVGFMTYLKKLNGKVNITHPRSKEYDQNFYLINKICAQVVSFYHYDMLRIRLTV